MKTKTRKRKSLGHIKKLSTLLALALKDLRKQERAKGCKVYMGTWWEPREAPNETCFACLAGSVMKHSLCKPQIKDDRSLVAFYPPDYDALTSARLFALNALRCGSVATAAGYMETRTSLKSRLVASYHENRDQWWADMKQLLADLREAGE